MIWSSGPTPDGLPPYQKSTCYLAPLLASTANNWLPAKLLSNPKESLSIWKQTAPGAIENNRESSLSQSVLELHVFAEYKQDFNLLARLMRVMRAQNKHAYRSHSVLDPIGFSTWNGTELDLETTKQLHNSSSEEQRAVLCQPAFGTPAATLHAKIPTEQYHRYRTTESM